MLKVGVLGAGHLGKIHLKCLSNLPEHYNVVGFYDANPEVAAKVSDEMGIPFFRTIDELIAAVDVVDIVTPTLNHYDCAVKALKACKHIFIEKPITETASQAKQLIKLTEEAGVLAQVGHVERFNPAYLSARNYIQNPMFIETHRLAEFNPRGTDVPVVLDLMIHDIDIVLSVVKSNIKKINASGVAVVSDTPDIANARIEFDSGCVANLTASRISLKNMRKTRIFQRDAYVTIDFLEKSSEVIRMKDEVDHNDPFAMIMDLGNGKEKQIYFEQPESLKTNAIQEELQSFAIAINKKGDVSVTLEDGYQALDVATQILEKINLNLNVIA
ncbi:putative dehydrogenase [Owenweeksia hongkongensis DSM 17368]|uniref:Putative dehydrogenase n=1 Tax=Owenweeksia hongkongensis (strain DSM 17368 / CIP 108786 / JCM 12287 / NRRL B-23963 / UST20020801) TaxID=926562 RepID=G8R391_OWEHD|nr:Gfo/Idh/MocA family oxidoreductase [Owenweeksia hongkongensis]AEV31912.1 putative dehydrogenase [Owenweeksia hongkongensis DSM 17368]